MKLIINSEGAHPIYQLIGNIDETSDFSMVKANGRELHLDCYEVARINSMGVRKWIQYFTLLKNQGIQIYYYGVSSALVEQLNVIQNFGCGGKVISVTLPLLCEACGNTSFPVVKKEELYNLNFELERYPCAHCMQKKAKFDDIPEEYFYFLENK